MALAGIQIYKLLPKTNCKDCEFPTCLAFAMKLAAKQVELSACPHVSDESKAELAASSEPPVRLVELKAGENQLKVGNETVLFRHEKTFYNKPGFFIRVSDDMDDETISKKLAFIKDFNVNYVGIELFVDGVAVEEKTGDSGKFASLVKKTINDCGKPMILISQKADCIKAALEVSGDSRALICGANNENYKEMTAIAKDSGSALVISGADLDEVAELAEKVKEAGVLDLVVDPGGNNLGEKLNRYTTIRKMALKKNFKPFGYPIMELAYKNEMELELAAQGIAKYAGFIVLDTYKEEDLYPLLVLRENIYTDPQKPIQVTPELYAINNPTADSPLMVTTNFSITYFSVANELESSGIPSWLLVSDAEGMSVLTAWAAGNFDSEQIAKDIKKNEVAEKLNHKTLIIPGHVAVISGELEEDLPGWEIRVGPREAVDLPSYIKQAL
jgi:acetyl-CoA decarbonylase/synthase complex subunit gamma